MMHVQYSSDLIARAFSACLTVLSFMCISNNCNAGDVYSVFDWSTSPDGQHILVAGEQLVMLRISSGDVVRKYESFRPLEASISSLHWIDHQNACAWATEDKCPVIVKVGNSDVNRVSPANRDGDELGVAFPSTDRKLLAYFKVTHKLSAREATLDAVACETGGKVVGTIKMPYDLAYWWYRPLAWDENSSRIYIPRRCENGGTDVIEWDFRNGNSKVIASLEVFPPVIRYNTLDKLEQSANTLLFANMNARCLGLVDLNSRSTRVIGLSTLDTIRPPEFCFRHRMWCAIAWGDSLNDNKIVLIENKSVLLQKCICTGPVIALRVPREDTIEYMTMSVEGPSGLYMYDVRNGETRVLATEKSLRETIRHPVNED